MPSRARSLRHAALRTLQPIRCARVDTLPASGIAHRALSHPQAAATAGLIKDRETEVAGLAEAARELAARTDDGATIGRLQAALLASQVRCMAQHIGLQC